MKKGKFILGMLCLIGAGVGFYYTDNYHPTVSCAMYTIVVPLILGIVCICSAFRKKPLY